MIAAVLTLWMSAAWAQDPPPPGDPSPSLSEEIPPQARPQPPTRTRAEAVFAAGCFWCVEEAFEKVEGVTEAISGYIGGHVPRPSYKQVTSGATGHTEAVKVVYDPRKVDYPKLLEVFWQNVDPFDGQGQFCDRGASYRPGIFPATSEQRRQALLSREAIRERFGREVPVEITDWDAFWTAEGYHQDYHRKNSLSYRYYKARCGRQARLDAIWGAASDP